MKESEKRINQQFTKGQKCSILVEYFEHKCSMIEVAKKYNIHPVTIAHWKRQMSDKNPKMDHSQADLLADIEKQADEIKRLKKIVADLTVDKDILEEAVELFKKSPKKQK